MGVVRLAVSSEHKSVEHFGIVHNYLPKTDFFRTGKRILGVRTD